MAVIVVGYVDKPEGKAAARRAASEVRIRKADRLLIVIVQRDLDAVDEETLAVVRRELDGTGIEPEVRVPASGHEAAEELIETAEREQAELIVIGLRRRSPVGKLILGSNSQRVLLDATCPVLAVKAT
ncbi:universal stress protein [Tenggerimyces flavus]|uniref:Universal stress protein n=1 Tax=Tenggerimyces flavus TaxID=1708749 RepID=A0ABV7YDI4_9ACTN|nr:universal stress protein [Tenggerimyces flavus]MBM7787199.1 nucleotide-binding universal stress UspA family protein [Tenggerimyces flavus]